MQPLTPLCPPRSPSYSPSPVKKKKKKSSKKRKRNRYFSLGNVTAGWWPCRGVLGSQGVSGQEVGDVTALPRLVVARGGGHRGSRAPPEGEMAVGVAW